MLPTPVSFYNNAKSSRRPFQRQDTAQRFDLRFLLVRARITNLAAILLLAFALISFIVNLRYYYYAPQVPDALVSTISRDAALKKLKHLVIVPGHAIWTGTTLEERFNESTWILEPYQKGLGLDVFFKHIHGAAEIVNNDDEALLVFSGGQTRSGSTTTEAESYMRLALAAKLFDRDTSATTDDHALDSYQNLVFSIARFHEYTGNYPMKITVVGYEMKRARFVDLHRAAIRFPIDKFEYVGIDPDREAALAQEGEKNNGYIPYSKDLYGCHSELLAKRRGRNRFLRFHSYFSTAPELRQLLDWCPRNPTSLFSRKLPWD
ncbi:hypothetical protein C8J56DRAFT_1161250 [Mycena floridula]|nr:hypothetical protein C8J56DRAFT_1161250 [Mycena floridula]